MRIMTWRRTVCSLAGIGALLAGFFATAPSAAAGIGTSCGSQGCTVDLAQYITLHGDQSQSANNAGIVVPPVHCWYSMVASTSPGGGSPASAAVPFDKFARAGGGQYTLQDGTSYSTGDSDWPSDQKQADQYSDYKNHYANPLPGNWYGWDSDWATNSSDPCWMQAINTFVFVPPGGSPPPPPISNQQLELYALKHLTLPTPGRLQLNPTTRSYVNLPTFVKMPLTGQDPGKAMPGTGMPYRSVTACLNGGNGQCVTVWAYPTKFSIDPGAASAQAWQAPQCGALQSDGTGVFVGSHATQQQMAQAKPHQSIDCGVTYQQPGTFNLTASLTAWTAKFAVGNLQGQPPQGQTVNGAENLPAVQSTAVVPAAEIQSINNGG